MMYVICEGAKGIFIICLGVSSLFSIVAGYPSLASIFLSVGLSLIVYHVQKRGVEKSSGLRSRR